MSKRNVLQEVYGFTPGQIAGLNPEEVHRMRKKANNVDDGREHLPEREATTVEKTVIEFFNDNVKHVFDLNEIANSTGIDAEQLQKMLNTLTRDHFLTHTTCNEADVWVTPHEIALKPNTRIVPVDYELSNWKNSDLSVSQTNVRF